MAYSPGSRVAHFSNPNVFNGGTPTGVESEAFNALSINNSAYTVSNFRVSDEGNGTPEDCGWSGLGGGVDAPVLAIASHNDAVYAAGSFQNAGGEPALRVAKWDGEQWDGVGEGTNGTVYALASSDSGLYVGGLFSTAGGEPASSVAKWDGSQWTPLGDGLNNRVFALELLLSHAARLCAAARSRANGQTVCRSARWP